MRDAKLVPDRFLKWGKDRFLEGEKIRKIESPSRSGVPQRFLTVPKMGKRTAKTGSQSHTLQRKSVPSLVAVRQLRMRIDSSGGLATRARQGASLRDRRFIGNHRPLGPTLLHPATVLGVTGYSYVLGPAVAERHALRGRQTPPKSCTPSVSDDP